MGFTFSESRRAYLKGEGLDGCGEKRKLSAVESSPAMSSHELMTSGGGFGSELDSESGDGEGKNELRVKRGGGVGGTVVGEDDGSRVKRPYVVDVRETMWWPKAELPIWVKSSS